MYKIFLFSSFFCFLFSLHASGFDFQFGEFKPEEIESIINKNPNNVIMGSDPFQFLSPVKKFVESFLKAFGKDNKHAQALLANLDKEVSKLLAGRKVWYPVHNVSPDIRINGELINESTKILSGTQEKRDFLTEQNREVTRNQEKLIASLKSTIGTLEKKIAEISLLVEYQNNKLIALNRSMNEKSNVLFRYFVKKVIAANKQKRIQQEGAVSAVTSVGTKQAQKQSCEKKQLESIKNIVIHFLNLCGNENQEAVGLAIDLESGDYDTFLTEKIKQTPSFSLAGAPTKDALMRQSAALFETEDRKTIAKQKRLIEQLQASIRGLFSERAQRQPLTDQLVALNRENEDLRKEIKNITAACISLLQGQAVTYQNLSSQLQQGKTILEVMEKKTTRKSTIFDETITS